MSRSDSRKFHRMLWRGFTAMNQLQYKCGDNSDSIHLHHSTIFYMCKSAAPFLSDQIIIFYYLLIFNTFCWVRQAHYIHLHILYINFVLSGRLCVSKFTGCSRLSRNTDVLFIVKSTAGEKTAWRALSGKGLDKLLILWGYTRKRLVKKMLQREIAGGREWYFYWRNGWSFAK